MENERWRKIEQLYHSALEQAESGRAAFVEQACGGDESLQQEVESLLAQSQGTEGFLEAPALDVAARDLATSSEPGGPPHPAAIGRYSIVRLLGEGGMGTVYEAQQEEPRRVVALKVIKLGLATPDRLRRFRQESQALARLQHRGIAQIYGSNTVDTGFGPQPFFAMEFIRGLPLKQYAEVHQLNTWQKLVLMVKVCEAVRHAHQRGFIHRDLKPGNILVDETGQPNILDFGVARITQASAHESETHPETQTGLGRLVGTLAYMSPEQVLGDSLEIGAIEKLVPLVYGELHRLAQRNMSDERPGHTLQTTALVNEACLRLVDSAHANWESQTHFFGACAQVMRRILVDWARSRQALKRGGDVSSLDLNEALAAAKEPSTDLVAVDDALKALSAVDPARVRWSRCASSAG